MGLTSGIVVVIDLFLSFLSGDTPPSVADPYLDIPAAATAGSAGNLERGINDISWSPCSQYIVSAHDDCALRLWKMPLEEGDGTQTVTHFRDKYIFAVPSLARLFSTSASAIMRRPSSPSKFHLLERINGNRISFKRYMMTCAFSPSGSRLLAGSLDGMLYAIDLQNKEDFIVRSVQAHSDPVTGIASVRDDSLVLTSSLDGMIRLWEGSQLQCLKSVLCEAPCSGIRLSRNERYVLAGHWDSTFRLWSLATGMAVRQYPRTSTSASASASLHPGRSVQHHQQHQHLHQHQQQQQAGPQWHRFLGTAAFLLLDLLDAAADSIGVVEAKTETGIETASMGSPAAKRQRTTTTITADEKKPNNSSSAVTARMLTGIAMPDEKGLLWWTWDATLQQQQQQQQQPATSKAEVPLVDRGELHSMAVESCRGPISCLCSSSDDGRAQVACCWPESGTFAVLRPATAL